MTADRDLDAALLARLRAGDARAFDLLHARHRASLLRYAERLLGPRRALAEDVVQEAFLRAHPALHDPGRELVVAPWLFRIVRNLCFDEARRPALVLVPDALDAAPAGDDPHDVAVRREALRDLVRDLRALPPRQRDALVRHAFEGAPHAGEARGRGCSVGANKTLVSRARRRMTIARQAREDLPTAA